MAIIPFGDMYKSALATELQSIAEQRQRGCRRELSLAQVNNILRRVVLDEAPNDEERARMEVCISKPASTDSSCSSPPPTSPTRKEELHEMAELLSSGFDLGMMSGQQVELHGLDERHNLNGMRALITRAQPRFKDTRRVRVKVAEHYLEIRPCNMSVVVKKKVKPATWDTLDVDWDAVNARIREMAVNGFSDSDDD